MFVSKYKRGVVLIEMLMSLIVISFIMLLLLSLMTLVTTSSEYERIDSKVMQVSGLIIDDLMEATQVSATSECMEIKKNSDVITYCIEGDKMIRRVNGSGYERLIDNVDVKYNGGRDIVLNFQVGANKIEVPLWSID